MNIQKGGFVDVDKYQQQIAVEGNVVERIAAFYDRPLPALHHTQHETRMACEFHCGKEQPTGDRVMAVRTEQDGCVFNCFQYGCQTRGNLLSLMWWMKHNQGPTGGRLKGKEFSEIARDLQLLVDGNSPASETDRTVTVVPPAAPQEPAGNVPLKDSVNKRARELVNLDERFIRDVGDMNPAASRYVRGRRYLTPEAMEEYRCGYLPSNGGSLLRGSFVYPWLNKDGDVLTWFGRNVKYEQQHRDWQQRGDSSKEPHKFRFVKGFQRGQELFNEQHFREHENVGLLEKTGVMVVEGPNDCIALDAVGIPAVAVCSNRITEQQTKKLASLAKELGGGTVTVMFDLDQFGISGAEQAILMLAKETRVRLAWNTEMADGRFLRRQAESISSKEWRDVLLPHLVAQPA